MPTIEDSIDIDVPHAIAFAGWMHFEQFPHFMADLEDVQRMDEERLRWRARIAGKVEEWDAEITETIADRHIAWRSIAGARNTGTVSFEPIAEGRTRLMLRLEYEPEGVVELVGEYLGILRRRVRADIQCFKRFVEADDPREGGIPPQEELVGH